METLYFPFNKTLSLIFKFNDFQQRTLILFFFSPTAKPVHKRPCFIKPPSDVRGYEGDTLALEAEVDGQPTPEIVWSLDGEEVANGECSYTNSIAQ